MLINSLLLTLLSVAELYASIYCRLADCYVLTHQLDRAVVTYERTLPYFERAASGGTAERRQSLLALNAHALSTLATVNFLLHNFWRAAVIYLFINPHLFNSNVRAILQLQSQRVCVLRR